MQRALFFIKIMVSGLVMGMVLIAAMQSHQLFPLKEVYIIGRVATPKNDLHRAMAIKPGDSLWQIDLQAMRQRIEGLSWVKEVKIWRNFRGFIAISLHEHKAAAVWQNKEQHILIARDGTPIIRLHQSNYQSLPVITGNNAPLAFEGLMHIVEGWPDFADVFAGGAFSQIQRWTVYLSNGSQIYLPGDQVLQAIERLRWLHQRFQLLNSNAVIIDLRALDRAAIRKKKEGKTKTIFLNQSIIHE